VIKKARGNWQTAVLLCFSHMIRAQNLTCFKVDGKRSRGMEESRYGAMDQYSSKTGPPSEEWKRRDAKN